MLYLLTQSAATPPTNIISATIQMPPPNLWPTILTAGGAVSGALIGAFTVIWVNSLTHRQTLKRERHQRLINAYAKFAGAAYRFLSHSRETRAALENIDYEEIPCHSAGEAEHNAEQNVIAVLTRDNAIKEKGRALDEMASARSELILLLNESEIVTESVREISRRTYEAGSGNGAAIEEAQRLLDQWIQDVRRHLTSV